jgi:hypothetical protein
LAARLLRVGLVQGRGQVHRQELFGMELKLAQQQSGDVGAPQFRVLGHQQHGMQVGGLPEETPDLLFLFSGGSGRVHGQHPALGESGHRLQKALGIESGPAELRAVHQQDIQRFEGFREIHGLASSFKSWQ